MVDGHKHRFSGVVIQPVVQSKEDIFHPRCGTEKGGGWSKSQEIIADEGISKRTVIESERIVSRVISETQVEYAYSLV